MNGFTPWELDLLCKCLKNGPDPNIAFLKSKGMRRVFIGIPVDEQSQQHITELIKPITNLRLGIRWEPESNRHLTLAYLGDRPIAEVKNLLQLFSATYQQEKHFKFKLSTLTRFPEPTSRIIALVDDPTGPLDRLFQITQNFLERNNVQLDLKAFRPHITLGRIKKPKQLKTNFDQQTNINLEVNKILFYQSSLGPSGSIYTVLKETPMI